MLFILQHNQEFPIGNMSNLELLEMSQRSPWRPIAPPPHLLSASAFASSIQFTHLQSPSTLIQSTGPLVSEFRRLPSPPRRIQSRSGRLEKIPGLSGA
jgi:hypothetical protein